MYDPGLLWYSPYLPQSFSFSQILSWKRSESKILFAVPLSSLGRSPSLVRLSLCRIMGLSFNTLSWIGPRHMGQSTNISRARILSLSCQILSSCIRWLSKISEASMIGGIPASLFKYDEFSSMLLLNINEWEVIMSGINQYRTISRWLLMITYVEKTNLKGSVRFV